MPRCLRCGAGAEWIEGNVPPADRRAALRHDPERVLEKLKTVVLTPWDVRRNYDPDDKVFADRLSNLIQVKIRVRILDTPAPEEKP